MSGDLEQLPCGCLMGVVETDGVNTFVFEPHALDCEFYLYFLAEAERQGKSPTILDAS